MEMEHGNTIEHLIGGFANIELTHWSYAPDHEHIVETIHSNGADSPVALLRFCELKDCASMQESVQSVQSVPTSPRSGHTSRNAAQWDHGQKTCNRQNHQQWKGWARTH